MILAPNEEHSLHNSSILTTLKAHRHKSLIDSHGSRHLLTPPTPTFKHPSAFPSISTAKIPPKLGPTDSPNLPFIRSCSMCHLFRTCGKIELVTGSWDHSMVFIGSTRWLFFFFPRWTIHRLGHAWVVGWEMGGKWIYGLLIFPRVSLQTAIKPLSKHKRSRSPWPT